MSFVLELIIRASCTKMLIIPASIIIRMNKRRKKDLISKEQKMEREEGQRKIKKRTKWILIGIVIIVIVVIGVGLGFSDFLANKPPPEQPPYTPDCIRFLNFTVEQDTSGWWANFSIGYDTPCYNEMVSNGCEAVNVTYNFEHVDGSKTSNMSIILELALPPKDYAFIFTPQYHFTKEIVAFKILSVECV